MIHFQMQLLLVRALHVLSPQTALEASSNLAFSWLILLHLFEIDLKKGVRVSDEQKTNNKKPYLHLRSNGYAGFGFLALVLVVIVFDESFFQALIVFDTERPESPLLVFPNNARTENGFL